ncbi:MAG: alpha/beta fold hydrolase [Victivallaceae bacterium]
MKKYNFLTNYNAVGYSFNRYKTSEAARKNVLLIHGWGVRANSMERLALYLTQAGFQVWSYDYPTSKRSIPEHAKRFLELYRGEKIPSPLSVVTHSMGGLILRHAMAQMSVMECCQLEAIVMLGPPNGGSRLAIPGRWSLVKKFNAALGDMAPGAKALQIAAPLWRPPIGIIAGRWDEKVAYGATALPEEYGAFQRIVVNSSHAGLRNPKHSGEMVLKFLRDKNF